eukprot:6973369-Pyramimonas_sp.AAC.3
MKGVVTQIYLHVALHSVVLPALILVSLGHAEQILTAMSTPVDLNDRDSLIKSATTSLSSKVRVCLLTNRLFHVFATLPEMSELDSVTEAFFPQCFNCPSTPRSSRGRGSLRVRGVLFERIIVLDNRGLAGISAR